MPNHIKRITTFFCLLIAVATHAQGISGSWQGMINAGGTQLRFVMNLTKTATGYTASFDSPDQKAYGIASSKTVLSKDSIISDIAVMNASYRGKWDGHDAITGIFRQGPAVLSLDMKRMSDAQKASAAPAPVQPKLQTPKAPFPYNVENIVYENPDASVHYAATFTKPAGEGSFPAVIIISGSGSQDRDGTLGGHKGYAVLGDYLTRKGIAVLRVDDRGVGGTSLGNNIDRVTSEDFARDVEAGIAYLQLREDVQKKNIGLIGHSEGGMIAPMIAAKRDDIGFIILLAGPGISGEMIWDLQMAQNLINPGLSEKDHAKAMELVHAGFSGFQKSNEYNRIKTDMHIAYTNWKRNVPDSMEKRLMAVPGETPYTSWADLMKTAHALSWTNYFFNYQPAPNLQKVRCPVLALNGESDRQVGYKENLAGIEAALQKGKVKQFTTKSLPGLNHMFQTCKSPADDYENLEESFSPVAMLLISDWIHSNLK